MCVVGGGVQRVYPLSLSGQNLVKVVGRQPGLLAPSPTSTFQLCDYHKFVFKFKINALEST